MRLSGQPDCRASSISRIERALVVDDATDQLAKIGALGRQILLAFDFAADPMAFELRQDLVEAGAGDIHLIERLHGREPRRAAPVDLAHVTLAAVSSARPFIVAAAWRGDA